MPFKKTFLLIISLLFLVPSCVNTAVLNRSEVSKPVLSKPQLVVVYNFAVTQEEVHRYREFFPSLKGEIHGNHLNSDDMELAHETADVLADALVRNLKEAGIDAARANMGEPRPPHSVAVTGHFVDIDQGSLLGRLVVGFGVGRSSIDTVVHVLAPKDGGSRDLLSFEAHSDSGHFPGAAILGPAGLAAGATVGGVVATETAIGAAKTYRLALSRQTARLASKITSELTGYFEEQGWLGAG